MRRADTSVKCGSVGKFEVRKVDSTAVPCLVIEKHWFELLDHLIFGTKEDGRTQDYCSLKELGYFTM